MKYDFETILDRRDQDSVAWDAEQLDFMEGITVKPGFDIIPMWIADMNFSTVPTVPEHIIHRAAHPVYGYFRIRDEYYNSIITWLKERHGVNDLKAEYIGYENGVLGGMMSAVNAICSRGDAVLLHSPCYVGFTHTLENAGYHMVLSPLYLDDEGVWRINYEDMEEKIIANHIHAAVFSSPHNPSGRVWTREELEKVMMIFKKHDVYVISDEIWADILMEGYHHIPTQSISEDAKQRTVALYAPSKTFNLAGLIGAYSIIYNSWLRDRIAKEGSLDHYNRMNVLSMHALIGAYGKEGQEWADELCEVLTQNVNYAYEFVNRKFEGVSTAKPQGTYMLYLDCTEWCRIHKKTVDDLLKAAYEVGVIWQDGRPFLVNNTLRMNLAVPLTLLKEALDRLDKYVFNLPL